MTRASDEYSIHTAIVDWLKIACPKALVLHIPNNPRSAVAGAKLKRMGMVKGAPDLIVICDGVICFLEVKKPGGYLSPEQKAFRDECAANSLPYAVVRGIGDVEAFFQDIGIKTRVAA